MSSIYSERFKADAVPSDLLSKRKVENRLIIINNIDELNPSLFSMICKEMNHASEVSVQNMLKKCSKVAIFLTERREHVELRRIIRIENNQTYQMLFFSTNNQLKNYLKKRKKKYDS